MNKHSDYYILKSIIIFMWICLILFSMNYLGNISSLAIYFSIVIAGLVIIIIAKRFTGIYLTWISVLICYLPNKEININYHVARIGIVDLYMVDLALVSTLIFFIYLLLTQKYSLKYLISRRLFCWIERAIYFLIVLNIIKLLHDGNITTTTTRRFLFNITAYVIILSFPYCFNTTKIFRRVLFLIPITTMYIFVMHVVYFVKFGSIIRIFGGIGCPLWALSLFIVILCYRELRIPQSFAIIMASCSILLIIFSFHRSAILSLILSIVFITMTRLNLRINPITLKLPIILIVIFLAFSFTHKKQFETIDNRYRQLIIDKTGTYSDRYDRMKTAVVEYKKYKWFGVPFTGDQDEFKRIPHNLFFEHLLINGYTGVVTVTVITVLAIVLFLKRISFMGKNKKSIEIALFAGFLFSLMYSQANTSVMIFEATLYLYLPLGLIMAMEKNFLINN